MKTNNHIELVCWGVGKVLREKKNGWRSLWLFIFLFVRISVGAAQSNKQEYALNDPRNPDCPCHKYQKLAEDEYKQKQLEIENNQLAVNTNKVKEDHGTDEQSNEIKNDHALKQHTVKNAASFSGKRSKRKGSHKWIPDIRRLFFHKHSKIKHFSPKYNICFRW